MMQLLKSEDMTINKIYMKLMIFTRQAGNITNSIIVSIKVWRSIRKRLARADYRRIARDARTASG